MYQVDQENPDDRSDPSLNFLELSDYDDKTSDLMSPIFVLQGGNGPAHPADGNESIVSVIAPVESFFSILFVEPDVGPAASDNGSINFP